MNENLIIASVVLTLIIVYSLYFNSLKRVDRIVFISIDTLRADHLSCYGYPRKTTPFIDSLAKDGILFKKALASISTTVPSHANMFTSLHPMTLKILNNWDNLEDKFTTLAEILKNYGFKTVGFSSIDAFKRYNLHQGFDDFFQSDEPTGSLFFNARPGEITIKEAIKFLKNINPDDKAFIFIHLYDVHRPYEPPSPFNEVFRYDTTTSFLDHLLKNQKIEFSYFNNDANRLLSYINAYDGEILYTDAEIKRFYENYTNIGLNKNTLWVITSDHGEGLGNHFWMYHGKNIYNEQLHVPLIFHFSSNIHRGKKIKHLVELSDLFPTILEIAEIKINNLNLKEKIQGVSLLSLIEGKKWKHSDRYAFARRKFYTVKPDIYEPGITDYESGHTYALQNRFFKYILNTEKEDEFFDLIKDPYETNNLITNNFKRYKSVIQDLKKHITGKIEELENNQEVSKNN